MTKLRNHWRVFFLILLLGITNMFFSIGNPQLFSLNKLPQNDLRRNLSYFRLSPERVKTGSYYINPNSGKIQGGLTSKLNPTVEEYKVSDGRFYLISGTSMAKFGCLAAFFDEEHRLINCIYPHNGKQQTFFRVVLDIPQGTRYIIIQGTSSQMPELYEAGGDLDHVDVVDAELSTLIKRARQMVDIVWIPLKSMPSNRGQFKKGEEVRGLPYSSVKEYQKFIGLDVSIHTFMTALHNPNSLLYTENVADGNPCYLGGIYHGENCSCFYGTVCSSFTAYCYGEIYNYTSFNYRAGLLPYYQEKVFQDVDHLCVGDFWWNPGHVAIITKIEKDTAGKVILIEISEAAGIRVHSSFCTPEEFVKRYSGQTDNGKPAILYTNRHMDGNEFYCPSPYVSVGNEPLTSPKYNDDICTWFGDKPCLGEWDLLKLTFNKGNYTKIIIKKDDVIVDDIDISPGQNTLEYHPLSPGIYIAYLTDGTTSSEPTSFEIINTTTSVQNVDSKTIVDISKASGEGIITYWTDLAGNQLSDPHVITPTERRDGKITICPKPKPTAHIRVIYQGEYGRVINRPPNLSK